MQDESHRVCVYCCQLRPLDGFDREHVLSQAFGRFKGAPVIKCVCKNCNQYFGNELELRFARGSFEALLRYQSSIKKSPKAGPIDLRYVEFSVPGPGDWQGVRLTLVWSGQDFRLQLIPQVAFRERSRDSWVHLTLDELNESALSKNATLETKRVRIYARSAEERETILARLAEHGITFNSLDEMAPPSPSLFNGSDVEVEVTFQVNKGVRRCIAKYAFNYLTHVCGPDFVLASDFDPVRQFVRSGHAPAYPVVVETFRPILHDDLPQLRQTNGHLLTINWARSTTDIVAQVSLFNYITYLVSLARSYSGVWRPIRSGIHFNTDTYSVQPLVGISSNLLR